MPVSTYEELLAHYNVNSSLMEQTFSDDHLIEFSSKLDEWEKLSLSLKIPSSEIEDIKSQGGKGMKGIRLLQCWKQRYGSKATYKTLVEALVQIGRIDLAEKVITLRRSLKDVTHSPPSPSEISQATPTSPASSSGIEDVSPPGAMSPSTELANAGKQMKQSVTLTLTELEEEFYRLVMYVEAALKASEVHVDTIKSRFRMLPQSVRRQLQTDENYKETRQKILDSKTIKELFDNLTALKHWSYMMPDTLEHILKDINNDDIHQKIKQYKRKLMAFKASTKLRELIGISFPVPDYCMELTMEVEGWENKTIQEVENRSVNIVRRASYGSPHVSLGWKGVMPGSIKVMFILMESLKLISKKLLNDKGIISVHVDGDILHNNDYTKVNHHQNFYHS